MALASLSSHRLRDACVEGIAEKEETALLIEGRSLIIIESFLCRKRADVQCGGGGGAPAKYLAAGQSLTCAFSARMATSFQTPGSFNLAAHGEAERVRCLETHYKVSFVLCPVSGNSLQGLFCTLLGLFCTSKPYALNHILCGRTLSKLGPDPRVSS